jgi:hypothetical protein
MVGACGGESAYFITHVSDITERREAEEGRGMLS